MERLGFPWAEVAADGSSVIGKHDGTGGQVELDRGRARPGAHQRHEGRAAAPTLKVAMNELGGYRNDMAVASPASTSRPRPPRRGGLLGGLPVRPRRLRQRHHPPGPHRQARPADQRGGGRLWRLTVKDPDERKVGRAFSNAMIELGLATIPGFFGLGGGPSAGRPTACTGRRWCRPSWCPSTWCPRRRPTVVDSVAPASGRRHPAAGPPPMPHGRTTVRARSGAWWGPVGRQGRQRQPRRVRPHRRGVGLARRLPHRRAAPRAAARDGGPRSSSATGCPRCGRSTS
jgi:hypothetical protein